MTNPHRTTVLAMLKICDLMVVAGAFAAALVATSPVHVAWVSIFEMRIRVQNFAFFMLYLGYWHVVLTGFGLYHSYRLAPSSREWRDLLTSILVAVAPIFALRYPLHFDYATAEFLLTFGVFVFLGVGVERRLLRALARTMRRHGRNLRNAIIVGSGDSTLDMASRLVRRGDLGYRVVELIETGTPVVAGEADPAVVGRVAALIDQQPIDEVFVALPLDTAQGLIRALLTLCEEQGITVRAVSTVADPILARAQVDDVDGRPVLSIYTGPPDSMMLAVKRFLDLTIAGGLLVVMSPIVALLGLIIKLDSRGPVFYAQERVGFNRRRFWTFKFRTMVEDAERQQAELEPLNEARGVVFKIRHDPRITRVGRWLRRMSIDELPQLFNVVRGEMSLVGPRPLPVRDAERIAAVGHRRRFSVKPGIVCQWQVDVREPHFEEWVKADIEYIDNWSLSRDFKILAKTIPAVLSGRGAY
jgi:exopolysaccharide biosynthesis polyprenyl glycosylphosphotransferase